MNSRRGVRLLALAALLPLAAAAAPDSRRGEQLYTARCGACHSISDNGAGPRHRGLFGCRAATQPGFDYSEALKRSKIVWNEKTLDRWLADPNEMAPGNMMAARLANDPADRADLIAYLRAAAGSKGACQKDHR